MDTGENAEDQRCLETFLVKRRHTPLSLCLSVRIMAKVQDLQKI